MLYDVMLYDVMLYYVMLCFGEMKSSWSQQNRIMRRERINWMNQDWDEDEVEGKQI